MNSKDNILYKHPKIQGYVNRTILVSDQFLSQYFLIFVKGLP